MRRFDQAALFDELAKTGRMNASLMTELADHIADFHRAAEPRPDHGGAAALAAVAETNHCCLMAAQQAGFATEEIVEISAKIIGATRGHQHVARPEARGGKSAALSRRSASAQCLPIRR